MGSPGIVVTHLKEAHGITAPWTAWGIYFDGPEDSVEHHYYLGLGHSLAETVALAETKGADESAAWVKIQIIPYLGPYTPPTQEDADAANR